MSFRIPNHKRTLSRRISYAYSAILVLVLLLVSLVIFCVCQHFLFSHQKESVHTLSELVCAQMLEQHSDGESLSNIEMLEDLHPVSGEMNLYFFDAEGSLVNRSINFYLDGRPEIPVKSPRIRLEDGNLLLLHAQDVQDETGVLGTVLLVLRMDSEYGFLRMLLLLLSITILLGAFSALAAGMYLSRRMLSPIQRFIHNASLIDSRHLKNRLDIPENEDELRTLALNLNSMLDRIEDGFERQGQFVSDASHELRTPLAILQGNADMISRWGYEDPQVLSSSVQTIQRQIAYMNKLVSNLLFLARADHGSTLKEASPVEVSPLFDALLEDRRLLDQSHVYACICPEDLTVYADHDMLFQMLSALLDNSVQYTPAGGSITLGGEKTENGVCLWIEDTGIGISQEHLPHIFSRFYRVDKARSRSTGGLGLGLAIAQAIAQLHGGRIEADSRLGKGTKISILLPSS